jgi:predicted DNA-binding transcriptional regulator AlpA
MNHENRLITEAEAAKLLGVATVTLRRVRLEGPRSGGMKPVPHIALGRNIRYRASDLYKYIDQNAVGEQS